jgi:hypothetical protein
MGLFHDYKRVILVGLAVLAAVVMVAAVFRMRYTLSSGQAGGVPFLYKVDNWTGATEFYLMSAKVPRPQD